MAGESSQLEASIISLAQQLISLPTQGGVDDLAPAVHAIHAWASKHDIEAVDVVDSVRGLVGVSVRIPGGAPGPTWVLDAPLDTASIGDISAWSFDPFSGDIVDGWLRGRGSADAKTAVALFCRLGVYFAETRALRQGDLVLLFDGDEHTGHFGGAQTYFSDSDTVAQTAGVMIGYPGNDKIVVGGRGFVRATITMHGPGAHSGSSKDGAINPLVKASAAVEAFAHTTVPEHDSIFPLAPKVTVTSLQGGDGFSTVATACRMNVDIRTTATFDENWAKTLIEQVISGVDFSFHDHPTATIEWKDQWPAYQLNDDVAIVNALRAAAIEELEQSIVTAVVGPSNIGNYLAGLSIPATAGFGLSYRGLHATDEGADLASLMPIYRVYQRALDMLTLV